MDKQQLKMEPEKDTSWLSKFWKKKVTSEPIHSEKGYDVFYVGLDEETPHGATH